MSIYKPQSRRHIIESFLMRENFTSNVDLSETNPILLLLDSRSSDTDLSIIDFATQNHITQGYLVFLSYHNFHS